MMIYVFDVDGTVCESCSRIGTEMADTVNGLMERHTVVFISGTDSRNLRAMLSPLFNRAYVLPLQGIECYTQGQFEYSMMRPFTRGEEVEIVKAAEEVAEEVRGRPPLTDDVFQYRGPQITVSLWGRGADPEFKRRVDRHRYYRQNFVAKMKKRLPDLNYTIGGTTSVDITRDGWTKAQGLMVFYARFMNLVHGQRVVAYGDQFNFGGNDYTMKSVVDAWSEVTGPDQLLTLLKHGAENKE